MTVVTLYHGTTEESARNLVQNGWKPNSWPRGGNGGQPRYLYLSTEYEDALWFAQEIGSDVVLAITDVPLTSLAVDPEDGIGETVMEEISSPHGLPGKVVLVTPLDASYFSLATQEHVLKPR